MTIKVFPSTEKLANNNDPKLDIGQKYITGQEISGGKVAMDVLPKAIFPVDGSILAVRTVEAGSDKRVIINTGHTALIGDILRFVSGPNDGVECPVERIDGDEIILGNKLKNTPVIGDEFLVMRHVTLTISKSGALTTNSGPVQFIEDLATESVLIDNVTPANNKPLPNQLFVKKDGVIYPVNKDTVTPSNTLAVPVEIVQASGTEINITAGDINVQTSHLGPNADSMRIGDGTNLMGVNASLEALVHDEDTHTKLDSANALLTTIDADTGSIDTKLTSTNALLTTIDADTSSIDTSTQSIDSKLTSTNSLLSTIDADTGSIDTKLTSTNALLTTIDADTSSIDLSAQSIDTKLTTTNSLLSTIDADTGSIDTKLTSTNALLTTIDADTGSIDTKLTSTNALLTTIDADTGSIDSKLTTVNTNLNNIEADTAAIEVSASSIDGKLTTVNTNLNNIEADTAAIEASVASIDTKLTTTNSLLGTIDADTGNIDTKLGTISTDIASIKTKSDRVLVGYAIVDTSTLTGSHVDKIAFTKLRSLNFTNNSGNEILVSIDSGVTEIVVGAGASFSIDIYTDTADSVSVKSSTSDAGKLYINAVGAV